MPDTPREKKPGRTVPAATSSEIPIPPFCTARESSERADPGEFPFPRGISAEGYRSRLWTMRQYAGFGSAKESNARYRFLLERGQTGLSIAFDLPTQVGLDSDDPLARGEVGRVGVAISTLEDMEILTNGLSLDRMSVSMTINATAAILLALYLVAARRRNIDWGALSGTVQNDILKEFIARGTYVFPPKPSMKIATDLFEFCRDSVPRWNTISISGYHMREAGSTAVEEVAFTLANGIAYVEAALARNLAIDDFAPRLSFFFNSHSDFFEEIAKFRAARWLWAEIVRDRFGARNPRSWAMRFHAQTAGSTLTAQQPEVNIVRTTLEALSAVLGGAQSLHTNSYDEALALPTESSAKLALRTQQVIAEESGVADTVDPLGGSYLVESWTREIHDRARALIETIDSLGGALAAIETGFFARRIEEAAFRAQRAVEEGTRVVVGVNAHVEDGEDSAPALLSIDPAVEKDQVSRLAAFRGRRNARKSAESISRLARDAAEERNLMPGIIACIEADATLGEIVAGLKTVYGEFGS
ncbi:MAG: acyl-CoA mutase large subunit family protein [Thermoanaerobaculia bacterium]